jgi:hypothetical protein
MTRIKLNEMTIVELVRQFVSIALDQDKAMRYDDNRKFKRLYKQMEAIEEELKNRPGDQRRTLIPLFEHPNAQVRLKSAITTLALAPEDARRTLQIISDRQEYPQAADARGMIMALDEGTYIPR